MKTDSLHTVAALLALPFMLLSPLVGWAQMHPPVIIESYVPQRVFDTGRQQFTDFESMLAELSRADAVLVGEQHDSAFTHRLEYAILEGLARRRGNIVVSLEMFERDVQPLLDDYLAGRVDEEGFLKASRPWPNYAKDYRPLIEFAKAKGWRVVAANVPRRFASQVSKSGLESLNTLPAAERAMIAKEISCPQDDYFKRFAEEMNEHPAAHPSNPQPGNKPAGNATPQTPSDNSDFITRIYQAQCVKDETMAEAIAAQLTNNALVVHFTGAFHSDYKLGTADRVKRRRPQANVKVISALPVENLDAPKTQENLKRGDYLLFTLQPGDKKK
jgi:uncharacterized iron-regulated protein